MPESQPHYADIKILNSSLPELDAQLENNLKKYISDCWLKSTMYRQNVNGYNLAEKILEVERADRLEHKDTIKKRPKWRSKIYLGWVKQVHISVVAHYISKLLSGEWFAITPQTQEDRQNAEIMSKVIKYLFETNYNVQKVIIQALYQFVKRGNTVIKGFWQVIKSFIHDYEEVFEETVNPITGEIEKISIGFKQTKHEVKQYNDIELEYVDFCDFQFYPCTGNFLTATKIHRYTKTYHELKNAKGQYINLDRLAYKKQASNENDLNECKVILKEAWIHNCWLGDIQISNAIVTVADDSVIVQYKPILYDYGMCPFFFAPFESIEGTNLGKGICFDALPIQDSANLLINMLFDSQKVGTYPSTLIPDGEDINKFVSQPGAIIEYDRSLFEKGLFPRPFGLDLSKLPLNFETLSLLKGEFEAQTVPEIIRGIRPARKETATRDMLVEDNSEDRLSIGAKNFEAQIIKSLIMFIYLVYRQRCQLDPEVRLKIARLVFEHTKKIPEIVLDENNMPVFEADGQVKTELIDVPKTDEELLAELPDIIPMENIDISVTGYETSMKKNQQLQNTGTLLDFAAKYASQDLKQKLNEQGILEKVVSILDLDKADFIFSDEEALKNAKSQIDNFAFIEAYKSMKFQNIQQSQQQGE